VAITSLVELETAIANWLNRADLTDRIPEFIALAEARFNRLEAIQYERLDTLVLGGANVAFPTDCREVLSLYFNDATRRGPLDIRSPEEINPSRMGPVVAGVPIAAAVVSNGAALLIHPTPDQSYTVWITYLTKLAALSDSATTNWLLTSHPDLYLFGALCEAEPYLKNDERVGLWKSKVDEGLGELQSLAERRKFSPNTPILRQTQAIG